LIAGLFLDGYAHQHLVTGTESFVTPWHAVFYSGFGAASLWLGILIARRPGHRLRDRIPRGYEAAVLGLVAFAMGGVGDGIWHSLLGVEVGIDALLSPTHLVLMASLMAIVTAPYRAAIAGNTSPRRGVPLLSLGVGTALAAFFLNFVWGLGDGGFRTSYVPATGSGEQAVVAAIASILVTTVLLCSAAVLALRLGKPRFGVFTAMFGLVSAAVHVAFDEEVVGVLAAFVAGFALDVLLRRDLTRARLVFALTGSIAILWGIYFVVPWVAGEVAWPPELWSGGIVLASFAASAFAGLGWLALEPKQVIDVDPCGFSLSKSNAESSA
jgi:hypothetical protein